MQERRRYFRIMETIGISYTLIDGGVDDAGASKAAVSDVLDLVSKQDKKIERLLIEVKKENPKVAELVAVFNQKLERIVNQMVVESNLIGRIAHRVKEANISACGVGFENDEPIALGARLKLELTLYPTEKKLQTQGTVVGCGGGNGRWYWRINFYGMSDQNQEALIQFVVQCQSLQLKKIRGN